MPGLAVGHVPREVPGAGAALVPSVPCSWWSMGTGWAARRCPDRPVGSSQTPCVLEILHHLSRDVLRLLYMHLKFMLPMDFSGVKLPVRTPKGVLITACFAEAESLGNFFLNLTYVLLTLKDTCSGVKLENGM